MPLLLRGLLPRGYLRPRLPVFDFAFGIAVFFGEGYGDVFTWVSKLRMTVIKLLGFNM